MPIFCKNKSKIKMVILTKHGHENLTWYSILDKDNKPESQIIKSMLRRFSENVAMKYTNIVRFYDNSNGNLIEQYEIN